MTKKILFLIITFWGLESYSAQIVFFKSYTKKGEPVIFEGPYSHSAIKYKGLWLHAHPYYGIRLSPDLKAFGPNYIILENPNYPEPSDEFVDRVLKMKFNIFADWTSLAETYCSKLLGQALNVPPTKMYFQSKAWRNTKARLHIGKLGLSPSDVYWHARRNLRFKKVEADEISPNEFILSAKPSNSCEPYLSTH